MTLQNQSESPHHLLASLAGSWHGTSKLWLEPDKLTNEAPVAGVVQIILDGRFAMFMYQSYIEGEPQHGIFTFGYNTLLDRYETSWVDSYHNNTAIMYCTGRAQENGFSVLGSYPDPSGGPDWGWRTEVQIIDFNNFSITAFNIHPEGAEAKAAELTLAKVDQ